MDKAGARGKETKRGCEEEKESVRRVELRETKREKERKVSQRNLQQKERNGIVRKMCSRDGVQTEEKRSDDVEEKC